MASRVDFDDRIPEITRALPIKLDRDETSIANEIAREAKHLAPRLNRVIMWPSFQRTPGVMAESIEVDEVPGGGTAISVGAFWGLFVEYGTEHMRAQPFMRPAAVANEPELIAKVEGTLQNL